MRYLQFINIVATLLDALKQSFSHRSMSARSLGKKDTMADAAVASLSMMKVRFTELTYWFELSTYSGNEFFWFILGVCENNEYGQWCLCSEVCLRS